MLFFALGRVSAPIFYKIRIPFLIFNIAYAVIQYIFHIFGLDDESDRNYGIYSYIGLFFCSPGKPTKAQRNMSLMYQIIVMLIGIINIKPYKRKVTNVKFESYLIVRIYNAICSMLHHWLPLIVQVSLCTSTIFNPSIFGWLSYIVMIIVVFKPTILNTSSGVVTLLFNICFIAQYLLYLGFPEAIFNTNFNVMDYVTTDNEETRTTIQNWIRWAGVYDVKQSALSTNCISAFVFTFYLTWHNTFVDYDHRYEQLPEILKYLIRVFVTYVFEIVTSIILIITIDMKTVDGFLSFVLTGVLLICSIFYDYPKIKSLLIMSISSICVIGLRLLSRLPVFTQEGIASWIQRAFGLPFQGDSRSEIQVIVIYSLERLCIHILNSDIYKECLEEQTKHMAYRYLRSRQLYIIEKLDKENIESKRETEIKQIKSMATNNLDSFSEALGNSENMLILKSEHMNITNENDKEIHWYDFIIDFIPSLIDKIISLLAISLPVNSESGINFLTLKSLTIIMKKISRFYKIGKLYIPTPEEKGFINSLPPSFALHYQSLAEACDYLLINDTNRMCLLIRYILLFIRKISLPLLTLILLIYIYLRPYIFSLIVLIIFLCIILPLDLKGIPKLYITFLSFVLFILMLRAICNVDLLEEQIRIANNSVNIQQMMISVISLFGIDPSQSSVPEILLFLATVFFVCDQLAYTQIYPSNYYYEKYKEILPKFPQEYCYGLFKNPSEALELNYPQPNIIQQIKEIISRPGLIKINHHIYILIIDVISFLVLFFSWSSWSYNEQSSGSQGFQINILFIFMLIIHVIFSFFCYYCSISCSYFILFILNLIWLVYTYCITFFYLPTCNRDNHSSLQFFFFLRFFAHLIICHQCFIGRKNISYKYPNFRKQWLSILVLNKFIHAFPYAFEIQTILLWMSKKTKVSLSDFFVVRDITQQLEILIAKQSNPYKEKEPKPKKRILISIIIFVIAIIIIFGILLILSSSSSSTIFNPPLSAKLELGLSSIGTLYESQGIISHITTNEHQSIIDSGLSSLYDLVYSGDSCYIIDYPLVSYINYQPIGTELQNINEILSSTAEIIPFFKYTFYFNKPTTISSVQNVIYQTYSTNPLTMKEKETLLEILNTNQSNDPLFNYQIPLIIMIPQAEEIYHINDLILSMNLYKENNIWNMNVSTNDLAVSCLRTNNYRMIMWSQQVTPDSLLGSASTSLIIYLVIVVILGVLIRNVVLGFMDSLWVDRMKEPQKLYRMIIAIEAFRSANDEDKEYIVTEKLLDTLRSKENCLEITEQTKD